METIKRILGYIKHGEWFEIKYLILKPFDELRFLVSRVASGFHYFSFGFNDQSWNGFKFDELIIFKLKTIRKVIAADTIYSPKDNLKNLKEIDSIIELLDRSMNFTDPRVMKAWSGIKSVIVPAPESGFFMSKHINVKTDKELTKKEALKRFKRIEEAYAHEEEEKSKAFMQAMEILNKVRFYWN